MAASHLTSSLLAEALVRWQHAAGPFWPYVCAAPFLGTGEGETMARQAWTGHHRSVCPGTAPSSHHDLHPSRGHTELVGRLLNAAGAVQDPPGLPLSLARERVVGARPREYRPSDDISADERYAQRPGGEGSSVLLVDLHAEPVLAAAPLLVEHGWYVVPIVQRWIASPAILPCRRLVERLVVGARRARRPTAPRGAVLIADGERMGPVGRPATVPGRAFDNRYEYQICRFPSTDFLKAQGVDRVHWISTGTRAADRPVRPDLAPYLEDLLRAGLTVDVLPWPAPA